MHAPLESSKTIRPPLQPKLIYREYKNPTNPQQKIHSLKDGWDRQKFVIRGRKKDSKRSLVGTSSHETNDSAFGRRFKMAKTVLGSFVRTSQKKVKRIGTRLRKLSPFRKKRVEDDSEENFYKVRQYFFVVSCCIVMHF